MQKMLPPSFGPRSLVFGDEVASDKLSTGIVLGYPILRIKGKVWSITRGNEDPFILMRPNNDGPRNAIDVVILAASQYVSKVYYQDGYEEGSTAPPDCFSNNGIVPDASSTAKQSNTCAACPHNKWGSRITPAGKKAKACADSKRAAVSPLGDIANAAFGGPMLMRVPAASLADFAAYGDGMEARGYEYFAVGTRMSFEPTEAYPKINFEPVRPLNDDEAETVLEMRKSAVIEAILQEGTDHAAGVDQPEPVVQPEVTPKVTKPQATAQTAAPTQQKPLNAATRGTRVSAGSGVQAQNKPRSTPLPTVSPVDETPAPSSNGFGGPEPSNTPPKPRRVQAAGTPPSSTRKSAPKPVVAAPPPAEEEMEQAPEGEEEGATNDSFEATLDDKLAKLNSLYSSE